VRVLVPALITARRKLALYVFGFLFVLVLGYLAADMVLAGDVAGMFYVALACGAAAFALSILGNWRRGVYFLLAWLLFEDLARKYLGNNMAVYFGKDFLAAVVYLSYFKALRKGEVKTFRPPFLLPLLIFVWFGILQAFNPGSPSVVYGAVGLKLYFYYIPLMFVGYSMFEKEADLRRLFLFLVAISGIIAGLGIVQAILGHTFLNPAQMQADIRTLSENYRVSPISGEISYRPTSIFVSNGRFAFYLVPAWLIAFGMGGYLLLRTRQGRILVSIVLGLLTGAIVLSVSRGTLLWTLGSALVASAAFLWGAPWRQGEARRVLRNLQRTLLSVGAALVLLMSFYPKAVESRVAFYTETLLPSSPDSDLLYRVRDYPIRNIEGAFETPRWPYGYGTGTASLGIQYVARILRIPPTGVTVESGFGTLVVEMGILGLLLWIVMSCAILASSWRIVRSLKGSPWFPLAFCIFWFAFLLLLPYTYAGMATYQDFVLNAHLWLLLGILFRLPSLALSAQFAAGAEPGKPRRRWIL
jgi:hypothetical protein